MQVIVFLLKWKKGGDTGYLDSAWLKRCNLWLGRRKVPFYCVANVRQHHKPQNQTCLNRFHLDWTAERLLRFGTFYQQARDSVDSVLKGNKNGRCSQETKNRRF